MAEIVYCLFKQTEDTCVNDALFLIYYCFKSYLQNSLYQYANALLLLALLSMVRYAIDSSLQV